MDSTQPSLERGHSVDGRRRTLLLVTVAEFATAVASTMVNVALPQLGRDLDVGPAPLGWVATLYFLVFGIAVPFYGRLGDLADARRLFSAGLGAFALGSLVCAAAPGYPIVLAGRAMQALGTAAVVGLGGALVARSYPPEQRGSALGMMGGIGAVALAAAAPLGGVLTQVLGWRAVFALSAAAGLLAPVALRLLPRHAPRSDERLDVLGGVLLGAAVGGPLLVMTEASRGVWAAPHVLVAAAASLLAMVLLVLRQRLACSPFIPRSLCSNRRYVLLAGIACLVAAGDHVAVIGVPLGLVEQGASAGQVGLTLLPGALLPIGLTPLAGRLVDRIGAALPILAGISAMLAGTLLLAVTGGATLGVVAALMALKAAGTAVLGTSIITPVSFVVPPQMLNTAIGLTQMSLYVGAGAGTAAVTAVLAMRHGTEQALNPLHTGAAPAYGDAFMVALLPLLAALVLALALRHHGPIMARSDG